MGPSRNLFNFNNTGVAYEIFCTKWKSTFRENKISVTQDISRVCCRVELKLCGIPACIKDQGTIKIRK